MAGNADGPEGIASTSLNWGALVEGCSETPLSVDWRDLGHGQPCREPRALTERFEPVTKLLVPSWDSLPRWQCLRAHGWNQ